MPAPIYRPKTGDDTAPTALSRHGWVARLACLVAALLVLPMARASGVERPNIIFIFADDWGYGDLGVHVPFIVRWPGVVPRGRIDRTSVLTAVDLLPTFLEAAGVVLPEGYQPDGQSALAAFKGEEFRRSKPIFWEWRGGDKQHHTWPSLGVRDGKWKLLVNKEINRSELYDLENDGGEKKDVAADYPELVQRLSAKLDAWKATLPTQAPESALSKGRTKK